VDIALYVGTPVPPGHGDGMDESLTEKIGSKTDLRRADLAGADLAGANLRKADLRRADLRGADLARANLRGASFWGANLSKTSFCNAIIDGMKLSPKDIGGPGWILYALTDHEAKMIEEIRNANHNK